MNDARRISLKKVSDPELLGKNRYRFTRHERAITKSDPILATEINFSRCTVLRVISGTNFDYSYVIHQERRLRMMSLCFLRMNERRKESR